MIIQTNIKLLLIDRYVIELIVTVRAVVDHSKLPIYYVKNTLAWLAVFSTVSISQYRYMGNMRCYCPCSRFIAVVFI